MVISIGRDILADSVRGAEIKCRTLHRGNLTGRYAKGVSREVIGGLDIEPVVLYGTISTSPETEERMMGKANGSSLVRCCQVTDFEFVIRSEGIGHCYVQVAGITFKSVRVKKVENHRGISVVHHIPDQVVNALETSVECVTAVVVQRSIVRLTVYLE